MRELVMHDYLSDVTIARHLNIECFTGDAAKRAESAGIEIEVVATPRSNGAECLVDAFFDPAKLAKRKGHIAGDPVFLAQIRAALAALGFPSDSLVYAGTSAQDDHLVAFEAGSDFAQAVLKLYAANQETASAAAA
jgi:hypothetical protein